MKKPKGSMPEGKKRGNGTSVARTLKMLKDAKKRKVWVGRGLYLERAR